MTAMPTRALPPSPVRQLDPDRLRRLMDELAFAMSRADRDTLQRWGGRSARRFVTLTSRRVGALGGLVARVARAGSNELRGLFEAARDGRGGTHVGDRTAAAIDGTIALGRDATRLVGGVGKALVDDPRANAPKVLAGFLGFYAGSGGVDGDGGIPDLDLLAGIDAHRALLTHSLLAGVLAEGLLLATVDLAGEIHDRLPLDRDPLWDRLAAAASPLTGALAAGTSAGIAYHLLWDAAIEPAPYHGLPVEMNLDEHAALMGANAAAEGTYAAGQLRGQGPVTLHQGPPAAPSTGRKVVEGVAEAARRARRFGQDALDRFRK